jgi:hypothetical protein
MCISGPTSVTVTITGPHPTTNLRERPRAEPRVCGQVPVNTTAATNYATPDRGELSCKFQQPIYLQDGVPAM